MAHDPLTQLRHELTDRLRSFWRVTFDGVPEELREHTHAVESSPVPEQLADEIIESLDDSSGSRFTFADSATTHLPLVARFRPRGLYEDDWRARPTAQRPWPVVLVHGTGATTGDWEELAEELRAEGWAVFAPAFGNRATGPLEDSADQIGAYIDAVLAVTGAEQVIAVGHSQGGLILRYWMRLMGGAAKVRHMVSLAAPNHGTTMGGVLSPLIKNKRAENMMHSLVNYFFGPAGFQQIAGSDLVEAVNAGGDLDDGVSYTCVATRSDSVIQPPETCFLNDDGADKDRVHNVWVQSLDPKAVVLHEDLPFNELCRRLVVAALEGVK